MKSTGVAYALAALGLLSPVAGIHRFYLGRPVSGVLFLLTWGFFGIGTIIDLINLPRMVDDENRRLLYPGPPLHAHRQLGGSAHALALPSPSIPKAELTPEQQVLRVASENNGAVTVEMVAVKTGLPLREAKKELERLLEEEHCTLDVSTEGAKLYVFEGLRSTTPLDLS
ncbi:MAG: TM2 domain-containing protein [Kofleriaceae bacterium]